MPVRGDTRPSPDDDARGVRTGFGCARTSPYTDIIVAGPKGDLGYCFQAASFIQGLRAARLTCIISLMVAANGDVHHFRFVAVLIGVMMVPA
jgi:hypothetical protein